MDQLLLAGEHAAPAALGAGIGGQLVQKHPRAAPTPVGGDGIDAEDHLPGALLVMERCVLIHLIPKKRLISDHTVHKAHQSPLVLQQPEVIGIHRQPAGDGRLVRRLRRRKTSGLHRRQGLQIRLCGSPDTHGIPPYFKYR